MPLRFTSASVVRSGEWAERAPVTRCPIATADLSPLGRLAMEAAIWCEQGQPLTDLIPSPTAGLLALVRELRSEFAVIKSKTVEDRMARAQAEAGS